MYLSNTNETLEIVSDATATTVEPVYNFSYNDIDNTGMILPQSTSTGSMTGATDVTAVIAPAASTNRQIIQGTIYNGDTVPHLISVKKDVGGTNYFIAQINLSPGMTLHYSREHNWSISGADTNKQKKYNISEFTSSGTWNKPSGLKAALVTCVGAGSGGGSGRMGAAATNRFGGGGGGSGAITLRLFLGSALASSYTVTCGTAGVGGAGQTTINTNGNSGTAGTSTNFGGLVIAAAGTGGAGGTLTSGSAGNPALVPACTPLYGPFSHPGGTTFGGTTNSFNTGSVAMNANTYISGGVGGSGISSGDVVGTSSNSQQGPMFLNTYKNLRVTGGAVVQNINMSLTLNPIRCGTLGIGTSGTGGNSTFLNGTIGAYGCGGGGGAGVLNGSPTSGAGGDGGGGICVVMEIL